MMINSLPRKTKNDRRDLTDFRTESDASAGCNCAEKMSFFLKLRKDNVVTGCSCPQKLPFRIII